MIQHRMHPVGFSRSTQLIFSLEEVSQRMDVVNFSQGGALAEFVDPHAASRNRPLLKVSDTVENIELVFQTMKGRKSRVTVNKMVVRHVEWIAGNKKIRYGVQFVEMEDGQRQLLARLIVQFQREYLKSRLRLAEPES